MTDLVGEAILVLKDELRDGYLTEREFDDYINLFCAAAERIFKDERHSEFRKEVDRMTKPLIELPSVREKRLRAELIEKDAELAVKDMELAVKDTELAEKDMELAQMKELLDKHHIAIAP